MLFLATLPSYTYGILPSYYMSKSVAVQVGKELKATQSAKITQSLFQTISGHGDLWYLYGVTTDKIDPVGPFHALGMQT